MRRAVSYLRALAGVILLCMACVALGRAAVWFVTQDDQRGLLAPPQVFEWTPSFDGFGGYSALIVDPNGRDFIAGSDRQHYVSGQLIRTASGQITAAGKLTRWPVLLGDITNVSRFQGDLEGLTRLPDGRIGMAFENYARIQIMDAPGDAPKTVHPWDVFEPLFGNELFEAIATLPDGTLLALFQRGPDTGQTPAYRYDGQTFTGPQPFPVTPGFDVSGADVGPDGCLYILERRYGIFSGFQFQLIRMQPTDWTGPRTVLYRSKPMQLGNAEAVSVWKNQDRLVATLITDDGFPPMTPTRIIELTLSSAQARDCADQ